MGETLLSIGHGYSARALGRRLTARGWRVIGTTRSEEKAAEIRSDGAEALLWHGAEAEEVRAALSDATHLLSSVAPSGGGDPVLASLGPEIAKAAPGLSWAGYLSTTGVYGDRNGGWVDETSDCRPETIRGQQRVAAEAAWRTLESAGLPLHIFRLAGIYGPGRGPFAKVRAGTARRIVKPGQVFSRIHVDDIATVLEASIAAPAPGTVYNVCDDEAAPPEDVLSYAARLLGLPEPPAVDFPAPDMSPMALSFYAESKRVSNRRIREALGVSLAFPTYRDGLAHLLKSELA